MAQTLLGPLAAQMQTRGYAFHPAGAGSVARFQVLGERASGTNVIRKTIEKNSPLIRSEALGWKHGFPAMVAIPADMVVVCAMRHAFDWALSMHKRPWHADPALLALPFSDFIRAEWRSTVDRPSDFDSLPAGFDVKGQPLQPDRHPLSGQPFPNILALRRAKLTALLGMIERGCAVTLIHLEALQRDGARFMADFRAEFDLRGEPDTYRGVTRRMGNRYKAPLGNRPETPTEICADDQRFIRSQIDTEAEARLGYHY